MTLDSLYRDLPDDEKLAFLELENSYRDAYNRFLNNADNNSPFEQHQREYITSVLSAVDALELDDFKFSAIFNNNEVYEYFNEFYNYVNGYIIKIRIKQSRRLKKYSVLLDNTTKERIRFHLDQMKELADHLELPQSKIDNILRKIVDLELEMTRERTRLEVYADLVIYLSTVVGDVTKNLNPVHRWIEAISKTLGKAKENEQLNNSLPSPKEVKKIDPPKQQNDEVSDDDIPF